MLSTILVGVAFASGGLAPHSSREASLAKSDIVVTGQVSRRVVDDTWEIRVKEPHIIEGIGAGDSLHLVTEDLYVNSVGSEVILFANHYVPKSGEPPANTYVSDSHESAWMRAHSGFECPGAAVTLTMDTYLISPENHPKLTESLRQRHPGLAENNGELIGPYVYSGGWGEPVVLVRSKPRDDMLQRAGLKCSDLVAFDMLASSVLSARKPQETEPPTRSDQPVAE